MPKYINADEVAEMLDNLAENLYGEQLDYSAQAIYAIVEKVNETPESIVRCKDCKYRGEHAGADFWKCENHGVLFKPTDFCSYAKRKEAEE